MTVKVLIVDDSATIRRLLKATLSRDSEIEIVGEAANPDEARAAIKQLNPDVITLDVEMPGMNGLEFLERLMRLRPTPVVMVSTLTQAGATTAIQALELGAVDCVGKPSLEAPGSFDDLAEKIKAASRTRHSGARRAIRPISTASFEPNGKIVAIGASTGGVEALIEVLSHFPRNCPPTLVVQHMPPSFTSSFAARLDRLCAPSVTEATSGSPLKPGQIYLAPGGKHLEVLGSAAPRCRLIETDKVSGHRPSVDVLFHSVARLVSSRAIGVILTGMGADGAAGLLAMRQAGADTLGQDQATSLVYGMPRAAYERGAVKQQVPLNRIADQILHRSGTNAMETAR